jgi:hypothetical protein
VCSEYELPLFDVPTDVNTFEWFRLKFVN